MDQKVLNHIKIAGNAIKTIGYLIIASIVFSIVCAIYLGNLDHDILLQNIQTIYFISGLFYFIISIFLIVNIFEVGSNLSLCDINTTMQQNITIDLQQKNDSVKKQTPKKNYNLAVGFGFVAAASIPFILIATVHPKISTDSHITAPSSQSVSENTNNATSAVTTTETFDYTGMATDEAGNSTQHTLKIKKDFSSAMIDSGPFTPIEPLPNGMYQWVSSTIAGIKFNPQKETCTMFSLGGGYWCTLQRRN
jgi:hypothetical protein